jgi:hypothetical protein
MFRSLCVSILQAKPEKGAPAPDEMMAAGARRLGSLQSDLHNTVLEYSTLEYSTVVLEIYLKIIWSVISAISPWI